MNGISKKAVLLGILCGISVSSVYSMKTSKTSEPDFSEIVVSDSLMEQLKSCAIGLKYKHETKEVLPPMLVTGPRECKQLFVNKLAQFVGLEWVAARLDRFSAKQQIDAFMLLVEDQTQQRMIVLDVTGLENTRLHEAIGDERYGKLLRILGETRLAPIVIIAEKHQLEPALITRCADIIVFDEPETL